MSRALLCAAVLLACSAPAAAAALPRAGTLVPGRSLGGIRLGESATHVRTALGHTFGVCLGCVRTTWYFTYRAFDDRGLAVELTAGRVSAVYTLWQPPGWHAPRGLQLGAVEAQVTELAGILAPVPCSDYAAYVHDGAGVRTVYYLTKDKLWGFGLMRAGANPCR
ncbi:MAG TPA: hypothetical protein VII51_11605 [Gaiellaceae bacterium]